jgi:hypothetical protein
VDAGHEDVPVKLMSSSSDAYPGIPNALEPVPLPQVGVTSLSRTGGSVRAMQNRMTRPSGRRNTEHPTTGKTWHR